jgi:hypothetical protein
LREQKLAEEVETLALYYSEYNGSFFIPNSFGGWTKVNENGAKRYLRAQGFIGTKGKQRSISEIDDALLFVTQKRSVAYAGPLAGRSAGPFTHQGDLVLVTNSPTLIDPQPGEFPTIKKFLKRMLFPPRSARQSSNCAPTQLDYLYGWFQVAVRALFDGQVRPGQALVLAGPRNCGKSLLQNLIITPLLGGRCAKPYQYMAGQTPFNAHLFGAEHQLIEDEVPSTDIRARHKFGAYIKQLTATDELLCHGKNKQALTLAPFCRLTISCNDEPENLMILPPLDESIADKLILLKAHAGQMPMPTRTDAERLKFRNVIEGELPALMAYLLHDWKIPREIESDRYGVREYHHPDIVAALGDLSPEERLKDLIDAHPFLFDLCTSRQPGGQTVSINLDDEPWEGTATDLERELRADHSMKAEAEKLFKFPSSCAIYLGRLTKKYPKRFARAGRKNDQHYYKIARPGTTLRRNKHRRRLKRLVADNFKPGK